MTLFYSPNNKKHGDFTMIVKDNKIFSIHIQNERSSEVVMDMSAGNCYGLSTSEDGINWSYEKEIMTPLPNSWKDRSLWAPCVQINPLKPNEYVLIYSAIAGDSLSTQQMGIAYSKNLIDWSDEKSNPVIKNINTNPFYYPKNINKFRFCDGQIFKHDDQIFCLVAAKDSSIPFEKAGCFALFKSEDLINWTPLAPIFSPGLYDEVEVPRINIIQNKFIIFYGDNNGRQNVLYILSQNLTGPYKIPKTNILTPAQCYAGFLIKFKKQFLFYHWIQDPLLGKNSRYLAPPKILNITKINNNILTLKKHPKYNSFFNDANTNLNTLTNLNYFKLEFNTYTSISIKSKDKNYCHEIFFDDTPSGLSIRDFVNNHAKDSRTIPIELNNKNTIEIFIEKHFVEVYINNFFVHALVLDQKNKNSIEIN